MKLALLLLFITSSGTTFSAIDCAKFFRFNSKARDYVDNFKEAVPGTFSYKQKVTRDGVSNHEFYELSDRYGQSYGHVLFDYYKNQEAIVIARLKSTQNSDQVKTMLSAKVISEFPYAKTLQTSIESSQYSIYIKARESGLTKLEALKEMPIYNILKKSGFENISLKSTVIEDDFEHIVLVLTRG
jgi:hypothetical protein